jgi:hypothetical protein
MTPAVLRVVPMLALGVAMLIGGAATTVQAIGPHATVSTERLPDLDQETPSHLAVKLVASASGRSYRLGFRSAVRNIGAGPLIVEGSRRDTTTPFMKVVQLIDRKGGEPRAVVRNVGLMTYVVSRDHRHWHYLQFDRYELQRYELRRAGSNEAVVADRKTGFCLGDRYRAATGPLPAASPQPAFRGRCGLGDPGRLRMREGISVGWGDDYKAFLEGQDLPLDGLRDGRYVLVHRVNADRGLKESSYANDAASVLFDLRWRGGQPYLRVIAQCPDSDQCTSEPGASRR